MRPVAVEKIRGHASLVLGEAAEPMTGMDARFAQSRAHRIMNDPLQAPAVDGELRIFIAGVRAARLAPDLLPEAVGVDELEGADGHRIKPLEQPKLRQLLDGMRERVDADAELADGLRLLVHVAVDTARMQHQGGGQAADAAADDNAFHDDTHS